MSIILAVWSYEEPGARIAEACRSLLSFGLSLPPGPAYLASRRVSGCFIGALVAGNPCCLPASVQIHPTLPTRRLEMAYIKSMIGHCDEV